MRPFLFTVLLALPTLAGDIDSFLKNLNIEARADLNGFSARVSTQFQVGDVQVRAVLGKVSDPADAFMVFQLGQMTRQPVERVLEVYQTNQGKGWGQMAKELGIKPGSKEFHALKRGEFQLRGGQEGDDRPGKSKKHGKGHGRS